MNQDNRRGDQAANRVEHEPSGEVHEATLVSPPHDQAHSLPGEAGIPNVAEGTHNKMSR